MKIEEFIFGLVFISAGVYVCLTEWKYLKKWRKEISDLNKITKALLAFFKPTSIFGGFILLTIGLLLLVHSFALFKF